MNSRLPITFDFEVAVAIQEDIAWLQVTMHNIG
jgi:hypothetical protein